MKTAGGILGVTLVALGVGCGSGNSSSGPAGEGGPGATANSSDASGATTGSCAGSPFTWKDDGATECASSFEAILAPGSMDASQDSSLEVVGTSGTTIGISIAISSPSMLAGSYGCTPSPAGTVEITYRDATAAGTTVQSCMLTLSFVEGDAGAMHVIGTFSAVLAVPGGATKNLTDGMFDLATVTDG